jgi:hypothetical protein
VYLLDVNLSRSLQPFMKRADDRDFFRCLKAMCVSRVSRSGSRGRGGAYRVKEKSWNCITKVKI